MDLTLSPQETAFRDDLRGWLDRNLPKDWKREHAALGSMEEKFAWLRRWQRTMYDAGWIGVSWPREYGGRGASLVEQVLFIEELARASAPPIANVLGIGLVGPTVITFGTDEQKKRYLPKILSGEEIWCQGFSEPNAGSDLAALGSEACLDGDHFILDGHKVWNSYGWAADWCAMLVRTDREAPKHKGLTYLLVEMRSPGVRVRPLRQITGESEFSELYFQNVRVPAGNVLGKLNDGWNVAISTLMHERNTLGANLHIVFKRQFDRIVELARQNGIAGDPVVRQKLGWCKEQIEVFRLTQLRAIVKVTQSGVPGPEGSILKLMWSEYNQRFQQIAQEILGPYGQITEECPLAPDDGQWAYGFLRSRGNTIEAGTSEVQRNIVAQFVLGLPKSY